MQVDEYYFTYFGRGGGWVNPHDHPQGEGNYLAVMLANLSLPGNFRHPAN